MKRKMFITSLLVLLLIAGGWFLYSPKLLAAPKNETIGLPLGSKSWGQLRGGSSQLIYFEASDGTIRIFDTSTANVYTLKRQ